MFLSIQLYIRRYKGFNLNHFSIFNSKQENLKSGRKSMTMKLMKNLMLVMMDLAILMLIEVQADLTSNSFHLSSLMISFSHSFKLFFF